MKKFLSIGMMFTLGILSLSCSQVNIETELLESVPDICATVEDGVAPRFSSNNLTEDQAIEFAKYFLYQERFFFVRYVIGFEPTYYILYTKPFDVKNESTIEPTLHNKIIHFRGIDVGVLGTPDEGDERFGIHSLAPNWSEDIKSLGPKPEIGEVIYEMQDSRLVPVGKRYIYATNRRGSECWIMVQQESVEDFEALIGY